MLEKKMEQVTSKHLYSYWNQVRHGRLAPQRSEIEPSSIAGVLAETFVLDCSRVGSYRFRLAGTRICDQLGSELRGTDLLDLWGSQDREALESLLHSVLIDGAVGVVRFDAIADPERITRFEMTLMPLIHSSRSINRILGSISVADAPYWLGSVSIDEYRLHTLDLAFPDGRPYFQQDESDLPVFAPGGGHTVAGDHERKFRVYEGGRAGQSEPAR